MDISIILEGNPWRKDPEEIGNDRYVREALSKKHRLVYRFDDENNLILIGPRRVGKTTYFKLLLYDLLIKKKIKPEDVLYVSCEIMRDYEDVLDVLRLIDSRYIFLDEITFVSEWERAVKFALDRGLLEKKVLYITGSSTAFLKKETFPGREIKFQSFLPLNFLEYSMLFGSGKLRATLKNLRGMDDLMYHFSEIYNLFSKYMESGGFPGPAFDLIEKGKINEKSYEEIYSWFRGDILKLGKSEEIMKALISRLLETLTTPVSYNSLGNYVGVTHKIIRKYLETLKMLIYLDFCYKTDPQKMIPAFRKEKKFYFIDPFMVKVFEKNISGKSIVDESRLVELTVFNTLNLCGKVFISESIRGKETDFLFNGEKIEVKWVEKSRERKDTVVLSKKDYHPEKNIYPVPVYIIWMLKRFSKERI